MRLLTVKTFFVLAMIMFLLGTCVPIFIGSPIDKDEIGPEEYSMRLSGLSPKVNSLLSNLILATFVILLVVFNYFQKKNEVSCEKTIPHLRRYFKLLLSLMILTSVLSSIQIVYATKGLCRIGYFEKIYLINSPLLDGLGCLFVSCFLMLLVWEQIKFFILKRPYDEDRR